MANQFDTYNSAAQIRATSIGQHSAQKKTLKAPPKDQRTRPAYDLPSRIVYAPDQAQLAGADVQAAQDAAQ